jgi:hypothetical protein
MSAVTLLSVLLALTSCGGDDGGAAAPRPSDTTGSVSASQPATSAPESAGATSSSGASTGTQVDPGPRAAVTKKFLAWTRAYLAHNEPA